MISLIEEPIPLMLLSYPEDIETVTLRKDERIHCLIPATVKIDSVSLKGAIVDLSLGGCSFACTISPEREPPQVEKGLDAVLSLEVLGSQSERTVELRIVNVRREDRRITFGCQFKDLDTDARNAIKGYTEILAALSD